MENLDDFSRYSRQLLFWPESEISQKKLYSKTVTIIGMGALGTNIANTLVRAGVGEIRLIDRDFVEESNLQRQVLFDEKDVEDHTPKVIAAYNKLKKINSNVKIVPLIEDINSTNIEKIVEGTAVIIDATDNFITRYLINDVAIKLRIPWIYGGVIQSRGMTATIIPGKTPCYRCLFPNATNSSGDTCDTVGVINTVVPIIANYQATEALKLLIEDYDSLRLDLIQLDVWHNDVDLFPFQNSLNEVCPCCQQKKFEYLNNPNSSPVITSLCGRNTIQITPVKNLAVHLKEYEEKWRKLGATSLTPYLLRLYYEEYQLSLFPNGRLLIQGTDDPLIAKRLYSSLIGE